jgi:hypothetical protein
MDPRVREDDETRRAWAFMLPLLPGEYRPNMKKATFFNVAF